MTNANPLLSLTLDRHRFLRYMLLSCSVCIFLGIGFTLWTQYQSSGNAVFFHRSDLLGNYSHSPYAFIYNIALMLAGFFMLMAMFTLFKIKLNYQTNLIAIAGILLGFSLFSMGMYPINYIQLHHLATFCYLFSTLMLYFFTLLAYNSTPYFSTSSTIIFSLAGFIVALLLLLNIDWQALAFPSCKHSASQTCWILFLIWIRPVILLSWCFSISNNIKRMINKNFIYQTD